MTTRKAVLLPNRRCVVSYCDVRWSRNGNEQLEQWSPLTFAVKDHPFAASCGLIYPVAYHYAFDGANLRHKEIHRFNGHAGEQEPLRGFRSKIMLALQPIINGPFYHPRRAEKDPICSRWNRHVRPIRLL